MSLLLVLCLVAADPIGERASIVRQANAIRPNTTDFRWQQIPWMTDADDALATAKAENRPLFVWLAGGRDRDGTPLERC